MLFWKILRGGIIHLLIILSQCYFEDAVLYLPCFGLLWSIRVREASQTVVLCCFGLVAFARSVWMLCGLWRGLLIRSVNRGWVKCLSFLLKWGLNATALVVLSTILPFAISLILLQVNFPVSWSVNLSCLSLAWSLVHSIVCS